MTEPGWNRSVDPCSWFFLSQNFHLGENFWKKKKKKSVFFTQGFFGGRESHVRKEGVNERLLRERKKHFEKISKINSRNLDTFFFLQLSIIYFICLCRMPLNRIIVGREYTRYSNIVYLRAASLKRLYKVYLAECCQMFLTLELPN